MQPLVLTVLRTGGEYRWEHVLRLRDQVAAAAPGVRFGCLTDDPASVRWFGSDKIEVMPLTFRWPGWWSKIEAFAVPGPVLYMDLDTTIVGDLGPLLAAAAEHEFIALRDFNPQVREMGSGLMAWHGNMRFIFERFRGHPEAHMSACRTPRRWGDQGFIEPLTPGRRYWQDLLPGMVVSYKKHCRNGVPAAARVVCYHGQPRPWQVEAA